MADKKDVENKAENLKKEIHLISTNLNELSDKKEKHYQEKNSLDNQLNNLINKAKEFKDKKQETDKQIRELKKERDEANNQFNILLKKLHSAQNKKREILKQRTTIPPNKLRSQIKDLEYKLQTEAVNFNKEKKIMDQIKRLKTELEKSLAEENKFREVETLRKESKILKLKADNIHKKIQESANKSSSIFDELTKLSGDISDIKISRNTVQITLRGLKVEISQLNKKLGKTLKEWSKVSDHSIRRRTRRSIGIIKKKTEEVKEKLKSKKKLTTDDILLLQREAMEK